MSLIRIDPSRLPSLDTVKAELKQKVQAEFGADVAAIITPGSAMSNVYRIQVEAAHRLLAGLIQSHPSLAALVGVVGQTESDVARVIKDRNDDCESKIAILNRKRIAGKAAIDAAGTSAIAKSVDWRSF